MSLKDLNSTKQQHVKLQLGMIACIQSKHLKISKLNETVLIDQNGHMVPGKVKGVSFRRDVFWATNSTKDLKKW